MVGTWSEPERKRETSRGHPSGRSEAEVDGIDRSSALEIHPAFLVVESSRTYESY